MAIWLPRCCCMKSRTNWGRRMRAMAVSRVEITEAIGPAYSGLEEAKADVVGMFGVKWLADRGALPKERLPEYYDSYVAGIFRTLRFGAGEAHMGQRK